jgi:preprotein translocase subunit SecF
LGAELATKSLYAILAVTLAIMLYIAWAFRKVSRPVPAWGYGIISVAMLAIDIIVPAGFFAVYAYFTGAQVDTLFVVALLALLGYCINDVIVIFDRIREHLKANEDEGLDEPFETTVGKSITETLGRSINTSLTVALALLAIILFGSESVRTFALVMLVGVVVGTFSSIARSAPLLIPVAAWAEKRRLAREEYERLNPKPVVPAVPTRTEFVPKPLAKPRTRAKAAPAEGTAKSATKPKPRSKPKAKPKKEEGE